MCGLRSATSVCAGARVCLPAAALAGATSERLQALAPEGLAGEEGGLGRKSWCLVVVVERCDAVLVMARIAALRSADGASECE